MRFEVTGKRSRSMALGEISVANRSKMMKLVSHDMKGEAAHRCGVTVHHAAATPFVRRERVEQRDRGRADGAVFAEQVRHRATFEVRGGHVFILFEPWQLSGVLPRQTERAVREDPLVVDEMPEDLLERPLSGGVREA